MMLTYFPVILKLAFGPILIFFYWKVSQFRYVFKLLLCLSGFLFIIPWHELSDMKSLGSSSLSPKRLPNTSQVIPLLFCAACKVPSTLCWTNPPQFSSQTVASSTFIACDSAYLKIMSSSSSALHIPWFKLCEVDHGMPEFPHLQNKNAN